MNVSTPKANLNETYSMIQHGKTLSLTNGYVMQQVDGMYPLTQIENPTPTSKPLYHSNLLIAIQHPTLKNQQFTQWKTQRHHHLNPT